ncbi:MAG: PaaX family transcriptional regulator, partial [Mycetocola sp.]
MTNQLRPRTLIEALLPRTGTVSAELIYSTAHQAGLADQPVRLALRRLVATGTLTTEGRGASAVISLTPAGRAELDADRLG